MAFDPAILKEAHRHSSHHRAEVEASQICGCFFCLAVFAPSAIEGWLADEGGTAFCPRCGIDSVIGSASGYPVRDPAFLAAMHRRWFGTIPIPA